MVSYRNALGVRNELGPPYDGAKLETSPSLALSTLPLLLVPSLSPCSESTSAWGTVPLAFSPPPLQELLAMGRCQGGLAGVLLLSVGGEGGLASSPPPPKIALFGREGRERKKTVVVVLSRGGGRLKKKPPGCFLEGARSFLVAPKRSGVLAPVGPLTNKQSCPKSRSRSGFVCFDF